MNKLYLEGFLVAFFGLTGVAAFVAVLPETFFGAGASEKSRAISSIVPSTLTKGITFSCQQQYSARLWRSNP